LRIVTNSKHGAGERCKLIDSSDIDNSKSISTLKMKDTSEEW